MKVFASGRLAVGLALSLAAGMVAATPMNFSFTGTFSRDDNAQLFNFTADGSSTVRLISYSYGGGTQADGNVVSYGGFDPILALFDSSGALISQNDDAVYSSSSTGTNCGSGPINADPNTGAYFDVCLDVALAAGNYTVSIQQYDNFAIGPNLSNGFLESGNPTFTSAYGCSNGQFCDVGGNNRTSAWAFDVLNVSQAAQVPEPATLVLLAAGLAGVGGLARRRRAT